MSHLAAAALCAVVLAVAVACLAVAASNTHAHTAASTPYRLGDMIKFNGVREFGLRTLRKRFAGTIAGEYMRRTRARMDVGTLSEIVTERCPARPTYDAAYHLRLGDVMCNRSDYKKPPSPADAVARLRELLGAQDPDVHVFTGNHTGMCVAETRAYLAEFARLLPSATVHATGGADDDFCAMVQARVFVAGKGGYSELIAKVREHLGRPVILDPTLAKFA